MERLRRIRNSCLLKGVETIDSIGEAIQPMEDAIFEEIYGETARPLWRYVARIADSSTAADDILQETYLRFLRSPPAESTVREAKPYLYKIATNLVRDRFRRLKRQGEKEITSAIIFETASDALHEAAEMSQVFMRLKEQERSLLWLAHIEGYDHREIGKILNLNQMSVRVLLHRARKKLAQLLTVK